MISWIKRSKILLLIFFSFALFSIIAIEIVQSGYFVWDDKVFLFDKLITEGSWLDILTSPHYGMYHPLTSAWIKLDYLIFDNRALPLHIENIILHFCNSILVYMILRKLNLYALIGFSIFLFHPLSTEVNYWITSRKDLLFCLFSLISIYYYIKYSKNSYKTRYLVLSLLFSVLSILSKTQAIILPVIFYMFDYLFRRPISGRLILEKIPVIIVAVLCLAASLYVRHIDSDIGALPDFDSFTRILLTSFSFLNYVMSAILPFKQSIFYPYPVNPHEGLQFLFLLNGLIPLILLCLLIVLFQRGKRIAVFIIVLMIVTLSPVIQLIPIGESIMNDRYSYFFIFVFTVAFEFIFKAFYIKISPRSARDGSHISKSSRHGFKRIALIGIATAYIFILLLLFVNRSSLWKDQKELFLSAYFTFPESEIIANTLGVLYLKETKSDSAIHFFNHAITLEPKFAQAYYNRALAYAKLAGSSPSPNNEQGNKFNDKQTGPANSNEQNTGYALAKYNYKKALALNPNYGEALFQLAQLYFNTNNIDSSKYCIEQLISKRIAKANAFDLMGKIYYNTSDVAASVKYYEEAVRLDDNEPLYLYNLAVSVGYLGEYHKALSLLSRCLKLNPQFHEALYLRGIVKFKAGEDGCADLNSAKSKGNKMADKALRTFCIN